MTPVGLVDDPLFLRHVPPRPHPERPERLTGLGEAVRRVLGTRVHSIAPREATRDELLRVHGAAYVDRVLSSVGRAWSIDSDTYLCAQTPHVALAAAGACIDAAEAVMRAHVGAAICLVRPPGHHAMPNRGMGFCIFNNVAVAAVTALAEEWARRVAVVDFDVHHGNGTQAMLWDLPEALYISLHQWPLYPGTGRPEETGGERAPGTNLNIPLAPGSGDDEYERAFVRQVMPALAAFGPDALFLSAGYDAHATDPMAGMAVTEGGYRDMAERLASSANGRVILVLEGGYAPAALKACLAAQVGVLAGLHDST